MTCLRNSETGFTLIEVLVASAIFSIIIVGVYQIYSVSSKAAARAQWTNTSVEQMRNFLELISRSIRSSTYPTTIFSDTFFDPCDNSDKSVPAQYYLRILKHGENIKAPNNEKLLIMKWFVCKPEKPKNQPGELIINELYLMHSMNTNDGSLANLRLKRTPYTYTTSPHNEYARSGKLYLNPITHEIFDKIIVNDVDSIEFSVIGSLPPEKAVDFFPISVRILTRYPKNGKVIKENSVMATPQVAIDTF